MFYWDLCQNTSFILHSVNISCMWSYIYMYPHFVHVHKPGVHKSSTSTLMWIHTTCTGFTHIVYVFKPIIQCTCTVLYKMVYVTCHVHWYVHLNVTCAFHGLFCWFLYIIWGVFAVLLPIMQWYTGEGNGRVYLYYSRSGFKDRWVL